MKERSFEERLRLVAAPPPNPRARAAAKDAALAEFERAHAAANESVIRAPALRAGWFARFAGWLLDRDAGQDARASRRPRAMLLGGLAGVFVAVFGLMSVWPVLMGRQTLPSSDEMVARRHAEAPAASAAPAEHAPAMNVVAPATEPALAPSPEATTTPARKTAPALTPTRATASTPTPAPASAPAPATAPTPAAAAAPTAAPAPTAGPALASSAREMRGEPARIEPAIPPVAAQAAKAGPRIDGQAVATEARGIDAVASEDLGALRDTNVAESMTRRPAINAYRSAGGGYSESPVRTTDGAVSTFSVAVSTASYGVVRQRLESGELPQVDSVRVEELVNYFDYSWPQPRTRDKPFEPTVIVSDSPWGRGKKLVHIGIKGYQLAAEQRPDANLVLLLDVGPSMDYVEGLPVAKEAMRLLLSSLKPTDTVSIVVYSASARARTGVVLEPTRVGERQTIWQAIETLTPAAETAPATPAIQLAYELAAKQFRPDGVNRVLMCAAGNFSAGIPGPLALGRLVERERKKGILLSVLGFGMGEYRDERARELARQGNGVAVNVDDSQDARRVMVEQATGAQFTIAKDVRIQVEFDPATVSEWRLVGYEARGLEGGEPHEGRVNAGDVGSGHTATAIYEITPKAGPVSGAYGDLRIRYKLPGGFRSLVIGQRIATGPAPLTGALKRDVDFSTAVAGFAQLLAGGRYTGALSYDDVARQAEAAQGADPYGYRAEFVRLVRQAQRAGSR